MTDLSYSVLDESLKFALLRLVPSDDSYGILTKIIGNNCDNDVCKLIIQRALLNIDKAAELYHMKRKMYIPYAMSIQQNIELSKLYNASYIFESSRDVHCIDLEFQVHKHVLIQSTMSNISRIKEDDDDIEFTDILFDGLDPSEYKMIFSNSTSMYPLSEYHKLNDKPVYIVVNLFDTDESIDSLFMKLAAKRKIGSELLIIVPYDQRMWSLYCANVLDGSYSFEWIKDNSNVRKEEFIRSDKLPTTFFSMRDDSLYSLHIRSFKSNKVMRISRIDFYRIHAHIEEEGLFKETRRLSRGFAEISIIGYRPVHTDPLSRTHDTKRLHVPYGKVILEKQYSSNILTEMPLNFAKSLQPPENYVVNEFIINRTMKSALQIKLTRNLIVPLLYHLFAYSTHIVYNGAIVTLQRVMSPELICQITEKTLLDIIPIKLRLLQTGSLIKVNRDLTPNEAVKCSGQYMLANLIDKTSSLENISPKTLLTLLRNPETYRAMILGNTSLGSYKLSTTNTFDIPEEEE